MRAPADLHPAVEFGVLGRWMDDAGLPPGPFTDVEILSRGDDYVTTRVIRGDRGYVCRRSALHHLDTGNETIRREVRLLTALASTDVPGPHPIGDCLDPNVLAGAVFYLMEPVHGFNATRTLPGPTAHHPDTHAALGWTAIDGLLALTDGIDHLGVDLDAFGDPETVVDDKIQRALSALDCYGFHTGYPGHQFERLDAVAEWLDRHRPPTVAPGLVHGNYHLGNLMFAARGPHLAAILGWKDVTIGDPLIDLGHLVATWPDGTVLDTLSGPAALAAGLPSARHLINHYRNKCRRDLAAIDWYVVLACLTLAVTAEGSYAHSCGGAAPEHVGRRMHVIALRLFEKAWEYMQ